MTVSARDFLCSGKRSRAGSATVMSRSESRGVNPSSVEFLPSTAGECARRLQRGIRPRRCAFRGTRPTLARAPASLAPDRFPLREGRHLHTLFLPRTLSQTLRGASASVCYRQSGSPRATAHLPHLPFGRPARNKGARCCHKRFLAVVVAAAPFPAHKKPLRLTVIIH